MTRWRIAFLVWTGLIAAWALWSIGGAFLVAGDRLPAASFVIAIAVEGFVWMVGLAALALVRAVVR